MPEGKGQSFFLSHLAFLSRLFSGKVEDSLRLRLLGLAGFWLAALAVAWVGGSPWTWLGGGIAATCGHLFSWYRRRRSLGAWPVVMALMVIALALVMRTEILAALDGNWLPLAHYLLLVQAVASFDVRTRGGLYAGLALSGIVLFFASQQAFELSFGAFLLGYAALVLTFLAIAFLEDETAAAQSGIQRSGQASPTSPAPSSANGKRPPMFGFWSGTAAAVLLFSVLAFLLLPRGESNAVGYQQVSALPITGTPDVPQPPDRATGGPSAAPSPAVADARASPSQSSQDAGLPLASEAFSSFSESPFEGPKAGLGQEDILKGDAFSEHPTAADRGGVVMRVRSPVASYWRGQAYDAFDGRYWHPAGDLQAGFDTGYAPENPLRYTQTFFIHQAQPGAAFMGYRGVDVLSSEEALYQRSLGKGFSYKVVSVQPDLAPQKLHQDRLGRTDPRYYRIPGSAEWLPALADQITSGASTGFGRAVSIVDFVRRNGRYDASAPDQLKSSAPLDAFLLDGKAGTSVDFSTATVMLARAAGMPARLVAGYLPGERDLLSGAYKVRHEDAHAWAEILFQEHGWVPFDSTPRPDLYAAGRATVGGQVPGLKHLFESSVGDDLLREVVAAPVRLSGGLKDAFGGPVGAALVVMAGAIAVGLGWLSMRLLWKGRRRAHKGWLYSRLPGSGRDEMLRIYGRVERILRKKGVRARRPGQTLREYALTAADQLASTLGTRGVEAHLAWFTDAAWTAAYNANSFPIQIVHEARARLSSLKAALDG